MINGPLSSSQTVDGRVRKRSTIFYGRTTLYFLIGTKSKHRRLVQFLSQIRYFSVSTVHCSVSLPASSSHQRKNDVDQGSGRLPGIPNTDPIQTRRRCYRFHRPRNPLIRHPYYTVADTRRRHWRRRSNNCWPLVRTDIPIDLPLIQEGFVKFTHFHYIVRSVTTILVACNKVVRGAQSKLNEFQ